MDYARYYLGTLFLLAGIYGFDRGGAWTWLGAATLPGAIVLDLLLSKPDVAPRRIAHPRLADVPLYLHVVLLLTLVVAAAWRVHASVATGVTRPVELLGVSITLAWLGVVPNIPVAHEFIHRRGPVPQVLGFLVTAVIADPLRRIAHVRGHHVALGLKEDSDTARRGETIYAFIGRAAVASHLDAWRSEVDRLRRRNQRPWSLQSDILRSFLLTGLTLGAVGAFAGPIAAGVLLLGFVLSRLLLGFVLSRLLLESFNYLQHYGLVRVPSTKYARRHSWAHLSPVVRAAAFEITNHHHHHEEPAAPFYTLVPDPESPQMPSALLCFVVALVPPLWERLIARPRLEEWDRRYATDGERALAAEANRAAGWPLWAPLAEAPSSPDAAVARTAG